MKVKRKKVVLEPKLEKIAGEWDVLERLQGAKMFLNWSRQLEVSAFMMAKSADDDPPTSYARLRRLRRQLSDGHRLKN
jgi:hypothetical protein